MYIVDILYSGFDNDRKVSHDTFSGAIRAAEEMISEFLIKPSSIDVYEVPHRNSEDKKLIASLRTIK